MNFLQPIVDWLASVSGLTLIMSVGGVLFVITWIWKTVKKSLPAIENTLEFLKALGRLPHFMKESDSRLDSQEALLRDIKHEVLPNGGSSFRDEMVTMALRIEKVESKQSRDFNRFRAIESELRAREERGVGIPKSTVSSRLKAHPSRLQTSDEDLGDTEQYPRPFPTPDES